MEEKGDDEDKDDDNGDGSHRSARARPDSGFSSLGSPKKSSVFSSPYFGSYDSMGVEDSKDGRLYVSSDDVNKPVTPRPSEPVCLTSNEAEDVRPMTGLVYAYPKVIVGGGGGGGGGCNGECESLMLNDVFHWRIVPHISHQVMMGRKGWWLVSSG